MMYWGRYKMVERISKPLLPVLGGSLVLAALLSKPDIGAALHGLLVPTIPQANSFYGSLFVLMALAGSSAGSISNLKYASFVYERGWRTTEFLKQQRVDLMLMSVGLFAMLALNQIAAAATLGKSGIIPKTIDDLAPMFSVVLGRIGAIVLALCLWSAVFTTVVGATTGYSLLISDIWHNVLHRSADAADRKNFGELPAYRYALIWFAISPLYVLFTKWEPFWITMVTAALLLVLLPVLLVLLLWLTNNRKLMGDKVNGWFTNVVLVAFVIASSYLTWKNAVAFLTSLYSKL